MSSGYRLLASTRAGLGRHWGSRLIDVSCCSSAASSRRRDCISSSGWRGCRSDLTFALAGWGPNNPGVWRLPNVHVLSSLQGPSLVPLYQSSDVFLLPSIGEGLPLVLQEALACGLPVICGKETAAADPGACALIEGVVIEGADPDTAAAALAGRIDRVLAEQYGTAPQGCCRCTPRLRPLPVQLDRGRQGLPLHHDWPCRAGLGPRRGTGFEDAMRIAHDLSSVHSRSRLRRASMPYPGATRSRANGTHVRAAAPAAAAPVGY